MMFDFDFNWCEDERWFTFNKRLFEQENTFDEFCCGTRCEECVFRVCVSQADCKRTFYRLKRGNKERIRNKKVTFKEMIKNDC